MKTIASKIYILFFVIQLWPESNQKPALIHFGNRRIKICTNYFLFLYFNPNLFFYFILIQIFQFFTARSRTMEDCVLHIGWSLFCRQSSVVHVRENKSAALEYTAKYWQEGRKWLHNGGCWKTSVVNMQKKLSNCTCCIIVTGVMYNLFSICIYSHII